MTFTSTKEVCEEHRVIFQGATGNRKPADAKKQKSQNLNKVAPIFKLGALQLSAAAMAFPGFCIDISIEEAI